jgi:hypothetical protein
MLSPPDSHVGEIERSNRTLKERLRSCVHGLPFKRLPKIMIRHMLYDVVRSLNQFLWPYGISQSLSPAAIVTGARPPDFNKLTLEFGSYVQVFEDNKPTNTTKARSLGAIALNPTGNAQGDYYFMSLATGARISRHQWTALPLTDTAIARVEAIAQNERQPLIQANGLVVEWRPNQPVDDDEYDADYHPPDDPGDDEPQFEAIDADELDDLLHPAGLPVDRAHVPHLVQGAAQHPPAPALEALEHEIPFANEGAPDAFANEGAPDAFEDNNEGAPDAFTEGAPDAFDDDDEGAPDALDYDDDEATDAVDEGAFDEGAFDDEAYDEGAPDAFDGGNEEGVFDHEYETANAPREQPYNLRPRATTGNTPNTVFNAAMDAPFDGKSYHPPRQLMQTTLDRQRFVFGKIMTQMSANAGIRKHGKAAEAALMAEFAQLEDLSVYQAMNPKLLTKAQKRAALRAINLIKEKRDGKLKGRTVADGPRADTIRYH